jgi:PKD repeat protein
MNNGYFARILLTLLVIGMFISVTAAVDALVVNYTITATNSTGGTIDPSGLVEVAPGANQTFIMTPAPSQLNCWGGGIRYVVWNFTVDGVDSGRLESSNPVEYNFTDIESNHTIHANFEYMIIDPAIFAQFTSNTTSGPVPLTVNFTQVHVTNNTGVLWSFGDNTTSTEQNPVHTYTSAGVYNVTFTIFCNNESFSNPPLEISVMTPPVANFTVNKTFGFRPLTVQFNDTSTGTPPLNYIWNFGDTTTSNERNPVHTYSESGSYLVNLTVRNSIGNNTKSADEPINVIGPIGGDKGYYLVHSNVDGAKVFFDDFFKGVIENGTLRIQVYTTASPYHTYTVEKDGYQPFSAPITDYPRKDQTIDLYANLSPIDFYYINTSAGIGGIIDPSGLIKVVPRSNVTFNITPSSGYAIQNVLIDGENKGVIRTYTFTNVIANHTISASFRKTNVTTTGTLYIASYPTNATILIDGVISGRTNQFVDNVPAGNRNLTLTMGGYQPYSTIVYVPVNGTKILAPITLTKGGPSPAGKGTLYVASYPTNATILINGTDHGRTNQFVYNVPAGIQNLTLTMGGYQPYTMMVNVPADGTKILAPITLTKGGPSPAGKGTLYVASYPSNATILINGTDYGRTDQFVPNVPSGIQDLTLTKTGYQPSTQLVNVPTGGTKILAPITLSPMETKILDTITFSTI